MGFKMSANTNMNLKRAKIMKYCIYESQHLFISDISYCDYVYFVPSISNLD